jgi:hypothetical protein
MITFQLSNNSKLQYELPKAEVTHFSSHPHLQSDIFTDPKILQ